MIAKDCSKIQYFIKDLAKLHIKAVNFESAQHRFSILKVQTKATMFNSTYKNVHHNKVIKIFFDCSSSFKICHINDTYKNIVSKSCQVHQQI